MLIIKVDSANVSCTTVRLPRQMLATKLFTLTMHLAMVGFRKLWVVCMGVRRWGGQNGHLPPVKIGIKNQNFIKNFKSAA